MMIPCVNSSFFSCLINFKKRGWQGDRFPGVQFSLLHGGSFTLSLSSQAFLKIFITDFIFSSLVEYFSPG
ncbi:MAG: hypothetical protein ACTSO4_17335 [Promethearchaeota archaeon]